MSVGQALLGGGARFGVVCTLGDSFLAEVLGHCGFDWICIDRQHGSFGEDRLYGLLQGLASSGAPALVRVPGNDAAAIMRALDAGAVGVIVPMVENATEAEQAAAACHYPPGGIRSWGPTRARHLSSGYSAAQADKDVICAVMVETVEGLQHLDAIASVPGIDGIFVGPSDLALALGAVPSLVEPDDRVIEAIETVAAACATRGKFSGIFTSGAPQAAHWASRGFHLLSVHSDRLLMSERAVELLAEIRALQGSVA